ncbi:hypothetical protein AY599_08230 [Leptolyngbya valderiana BDU 20041]|nr:hypothetical protein AY599_08230 [Leptolyngbya valderiana BDU 20041]
MATHNFSNLEGFVEHNENFTITEPSDRYRFTLTDPGQLNLGFLESQSAIDWTLESESGEVLETGRLTNTSSSDFSISDLVAGSYDLVFESQDASDYRFSLEPDYDAVTGLEITGGYFTVEDEDITVDYLLDGGRYEGEIDPVIIEDRTDAARLEPNFNWETDVENGGTYPRRDRTSIPEVTDSDYLQPLQWSLSQPIDPSDPNSNIIGVWEHPTLRNPKTGEPLSGEGVVVAIVDDGLKYDHQEFNPAKGGRYRPDLSWDYTDDDDNPFPISAKTFSIDLEIDDFSKDSFTFDIPVSLTGIVLDVDIDFGNTNLTPAEFKTLQDIAIELVAPENIIDGGDNWFSLRNYYWYVPGHENSDPPASDFIQENTPGELSLMLDNGFDRSFAGGSWKLHFYNGTYGPIKEDWKSVLDKLDSFTLNLTTIHPHGTAVAGIIADEDGEIGTRGIAPNADLAALRLIGNIDAIDSSYDTYGSKVAQALYNYQRNQDIDIFNNSWGSFPLQHQPLATYALELGAKYGLNGLGNTYIFSAGNDRSRDFGSGLGYAQVNDYALTNSRHAIAVGAVTFKEDNGELQIVRAPYSNPGVFVSAFSDSGLTGNSDGTDIVTTGVEIDRLDLDTYLGFPSGTSGFGGTSASAAFVSGVVALMREVNPNLTNRDIQHILAETAYKVDPTHQPDEVDPDYNRPQSGWTTNGAGYEIDYQYGFGTVNPKAAVELAAEWTSVDPEVLVTSHFRYINANLPNGDSSGLSDTVSVAEDITLEWAEVVTDIDLEDWKDLTVVLTSPDGTESVLRHSTPDLDISGVEVPPLVPQDPFWTGTWKFTTPRFWGESSQGEWTLQVIDEKGNDISGEWNGWKLNLYGTSFQERS